MLPMMLVLLVEDELFIRDLLGDSLKDAGFEVIAATNGVQALSELENGVDRFKAVITDIRLGDGPTGWDVAKRARELDSNMPIVYMTGDSVSDWAALGVPKSIMVAKPFAPAQVVTAVASLITDADIHREG